MVCLSAVAALRPRAIGLDEPFANLDAENAFRLRRTLSALRETAGRLASENAALQEALARERVERERMEREGLERERVQATPAPEEVPADAAPLASMEEVERRHIQEALKRAAGRIGGPGGAADLLGMNPSTLRSRMKRCGVKRP